MTEVVEASIREAYGKTLQELGRENNKIVVLDSDLSKSTMTMYFCQEFPDRFFNCGLAEQNMVGIAAGLAASGKIPFTSTFSIFAACRCFDQARMSLGQQHLNIKIVATHGGISVGEDGASHHAIEDLALYCSLPGVNVVVPADAVETVEVIRAAVRIEEPFYIRLARPKTPVIHGKGYRFALGKAEKLVDGNDVTIISMGIIVPRALEAAESLKRQKISCRVINMSTLKPLDRDIVINAARETGAIVTAEEHLLHGGLGSTVAQVLARTYPCPMECIGIEDVYTKSGTPDELLQKHGLTAENIERTAKLLLHRK